jgi:hypothetical protein
MRCLSQPTTVDLFFTLRGTQTPKDPFVMTLADAVTRFGGKIKEEFL